MLTLGNFETHAGRTIVQRGKDYYRTGAIIEIEEVDESFWQAQVSGSAVYEVEIHLKNVTEISNYDCSCPYDDGMCKHVVAVLFTLREDLMKAPSGNSRGIAKNKKAAFGDLLNKITLQDYQTFIAQYASRNKDFRTEFEIYFSEKDERIDVGQKYADLTRKIVRKYSDRDFIGYRETFGLSNDMDQFLHSGFDLVNKNNFRDAFLLSKAVLKETMDVIQYCDDSAGNIGMILDNTTHLIQDIAEADNAAIDLKEQIFKYLQTELTNPNYFDFGDFGYHLFSILQELAVHLGKTDEFLAFLDTQPPTRDDYTGEYRRNFLKTRKIDFLKAIGKPEEAEKLVLQNLDIVEVRQEEVNKAIIQKAFAAAKKLIADGIKIAESKKHPGTVANWEKELLRIAVLENDVKTVRYYTKHFAFDRWFDTNYYNQWKKTYPEVEWKEVIEKHIAETIEAVTKSHKKNKGMIWYKPDPPLLNSLAPIYIEEQFFDRLLALLKREDNLDTILSYHSYLIKIYPADLLEIYLPALQRRGDYASSRNEYSDLVKKMKKIAKDLPEGQDRIISVAQRLKEKYPRRPAMIEELNRLLK